MNAIDPAEARDYLSDDLDLNGESWEGFEDWFSDLATYLQSLSPDHTFCQRLAVCLEPFLADEDRIECTMYPRGEATTYMDEQTPTVDFDVYLESLITAIEADHRRWVAHVEVAGSGAYWTLESGPPLTARY